MKQSHSLALLLNLTLLSMAAIYVTAAAPIQSDFIRSSCKATRYPALCIQSLLTYAPSVRHSPRQLAHAALTVSLTRAQSTSAFIKQQFPKPDPARSRQAGAIKDCLDTMKDGVDQLRQSVQEMGRMGRIHTRRFRFFVRQNKNNSFILSFFCSYQLVTSCSHVSFLSYLIKLMIIANYIYRWHLSNVQTWVSAALTDTNTCLDSLSHNAGPTVRTAVRKRVVEVAQVTSNALALVNRLAPHYWTVNPGMVGIM